MHWSQGSYDYEVMKREVLREENQKLFLAIRDQIFKRLEVSGAIAMWAAMELPSGFGAEDSYTMMACVDRLVELGEIKEITGEDVAGQDRVFVRRLC